MVGGKPAWLGAKIDVKVRLCKYRAKSSTSWYITPLHLSCCRAALIKKIQLPKLLGGSWFPYSVIYPQLNLVSTPQASGPFIIKSNDRLASKASSKSLQLSPDADWHGSSPSLTYPIPTLTLRHNNIPWVSNKLTLLPLCLKGQDAWVRADGALLFTAENFCAL